MGHPPQQAATEDASTSGRSPEIQNIGRSEEHKDVPKSDPSGLEKEADNREGKTKESTCSRTDEEQRLMEETDSEEIGIAHLSNEEVAILMENGFKESIFLLRTQHQAAMAALRSIKMEKGQSLKSKSKENHRPLDGGMKQKELSDEHQSIPVGPISDKYKEAIEKTKTGQNLDINSEESFPELKDHQPLDGELEDLRRVSEGGKEMEREEELELERQRAVEKMASDLPEKQNLEGDETSGDEGKATAVIGGAYGILGQVAVQRMEHSSLSDLAVICWTLCIVLCL
nr:hypothetical protein Iba_chr11fCG13640 [Ipomoea batatas]